MKLVIFGGRDFTDIFKMSSVLHQATINGFIPFDIKPTLIC